MVKRKILVVTEDAELCPLIQRHLRNNVAEICCVTSPSNVLIHMSKSEFCLTILDLQLPGIEMLEMVRIVRLSQQTPILAVTEPLESVKKAALFRAGVDALLEKPIEAEICAAQAESLMRLRSWANEGTERKSILTFGSTLVICPRFRQVLVNGEPLELTKKEFDLLYFLAGKQRQVFSREQLFDQLWDYNFELGGNDTVKVHINTLRKKLMVLGYNAIENIRGVGYRFIPPPDTTL